MSVAAFSTTPETAIPRTLGYTFYVDGQRAGRSDIRVTERSDAILFESKTHVTLGPNTIELACRTEADPKTYRIRRFSFEGTKGGKPASGEVNLVGSDSAYGWVGGGENRVARGRRAKGKQIVLLEDWVMELQVLLALTQGLAPRPETYRLLFAASFLPTDVIAGYTGEVAVESETGTLIARRLGVAIQGAAPFESHVDRERGVPVYIRFPGSRTEVFLDDFFGDNPKPRFEKAPAGSSRP